MARSRRLGERRENCLRYCMLCLLKYVSRICFQNGAAEKISDKKNGLGAPAVFSNEGENTTADFEDTLYVTKVQLCNKTLIYWSSGSQMCFPSTPYVFRDDGQGKEIEVLGNRKLTVTRRTSS